MGKIFDFNSLPPHERIMGSLQEDLLPKDWNNLMQTYSKPCHFTNFDTIQMTTADYQKLQKSLPPTQPSEIFTRPALNIFTVILKGDSGNLYLHFRPTALPKTTLTKKKYDGSAIQIHPKVDMYMSISGADHVDFVVAIGCSKHADNSETIFSTPLWYRPTYQDKTPAELSSISKIYLVLQVAMRERPTIFVEESQNEIIIPAAPHKKTSKTSRKSKPNKVKLVRSIRIDATKISKGTHSITCPSWGVIGHYRQYKNGKKVWIAPYTKGRERHKPASYQPKEYQLQSPTEDTTE